MIYLYMFNFCHNFSTSSYEYNTSSYEIKVLTGLMLKDGYIANSNRHKRATGNSIYRIILKAASLDFVLWLKHDVLKSFCNDKMPTA